MTNQAWEDFKEKYIQLAKEEGMKKGIKKGRSEGIEQGIRYERSETLAALGMTAEALEQKKKEYRLKNNLA